jgi:tRNA nucleotidyltransferase/poly(A) polymerase
MAMKIYQVGGCVRDELMGVTPKDIDLACEAESFEAMEQYIRDNGGKVYQSKPEFFTVRARLFGEDRDFVLCRKESKYSDGRRPDSVEVGTIYDDLARRDFTMNAIAKDESGNYIDPYGGINDIAVGVIKCVGNPAERLNEDPLRVLRMIRFAVTKDFHIESKTSAAVDEHVIKKLFESVSIDRIREELHKCFAHNTYMTLRWLLTYDLLRIFVKTEVWLKPTLEEK